MALNPATLGPALATAAGSVDPAGQAAWLAIATALISHIQANAVVSPAGTPVPLTWPGGLSPAPVTGTGKIL